MEGVNKVLRRLVEITTAIGSAWDVGGNQAITPIEVTVCRTVIAGILDCPDALNAILILILGTEIVVDVRFKAIVGIE